MSAFGGKADVNHQLGESPLIAESGHWYCLSYEMWGQLKGPFTTGPGAGRPFKSSVKPSMNYC